MYEKFPEFQTLRPGHYAVFTGKIIQREDCAGSIRPRGPPYPAPARKEHGGRHAAPPPRRAEATPPAHPGSANRCRMRPPRMRPRLPVPGKHSFQSTGGTRPRPGHYSIRSANRQPNPTVRTSAAKEKGVPGPRDADIPSNTPPEANQAPRAGPPRGCAPWRRGARGQGSSR